MNKTTNLRRLLGAAAGAALLWGAGGGAALAADADTEARIEALEAQLAALQQELAALKVSAKAEPKAAKVSIAGGKPSIASGDGAFSLNLKAVMQLDAAHYLQDDDLAAAVVGRDLNSGTNVRRGRLGVEGKLFTDFAYGVLLDFGGSGTDGETTLHELWLQYSPIAPLKLRVGAFAPNVGLADAASTNGSLFPERPSAAAVARGLAADDKRIAAQVLAGGERWLAAAAVTGAKAGDGATFDEQLGYTVRLAGTPLAGEDWRLHLGANASIVAQPAQAALDGPYPVTLQDRPELRVDGTRLVSTGAIDAGGAHHIGLEAAVQRGPLLVQGEYFDFAVERRVSSPGLSDPTFNGWYIEAGYVLTGEARKYNTGTAAFDAPPVSRPFDPAAGQWGAFELVGRYSRLDLNHNEDAALAADRVRGGEQTIWSGGINWFVNPLIKFGLHYLDVSVDRQSSAGVETGQDFQAVNLRSQFAF